MCVWETRPLGDRGSYESETQMLYAAVVTLRFTLHIFERKRRRKQTKHAHTHTHIYLKHDCKCPVCWTVVHYSAWTLGVGWCGWERERGGERYGREKDIKGERLQARNVSVYKKVCLNGGSGERLWIGLHIRTHTHSHTHSLMARVSIHTVGGSHHWWE